MKALKFCGFNHHCEIVQDGDEVTTSFREIPPKMASTELMVASESFYEVQIFNDKKRFVVKSNLKDTIDATIKFAEKITDIQLTGEYFFVIHEGGLVSQYDVDNHILTKLNLPLGSDYEQLTCITATHKALYGMSNLNCFYKLVDIPKRGPPREDIKRIYEFPKHQTICKISSGLEHLLFLTKGGDVYSMGCGLRGQLGHCDVNNQDEPKLIAALAGIKIRDISCGAFHSFVVSAFGDLYGFGWNSCGQLGIRRSISGFKKNERVYALPTLINVDLEEEENDSVRSVHCGHKYTVFLSVNGRAFSTGLNNFGQLGLGNTMDHYGFQEIRAGVEEEFEIFCGYATTYLVHNGQN